jgi:hypothetical protein
MENGKTWAFCHLPFAIFHQAGFFSAACYANLTTRVTG